MQDNSFDKVRRWVRQGLQMGATGWVLGATGAALVAVGVWRGSLLLGGLGVAGLLAAAWRWRWPGRALGRWRQRATAASPAAAAAAVIPAKRTPHPKGTEGDALVADMLEHGRYALLLRPQVIDNLSDRHLQETVTELQQRMALVPKGHVVLEQTALEDERDGEQTDSLSHSQGRLVEVELLFLDRHAVTNLQYQQFVDGGGYEEMAIWDEEVLPALLDFVDRTGQPGPRFWKDGRFPSGKQDHPVVGISWFEACAYARWVGKRLPTDAEWCKAACWPVSISPGNWLQRKFPWGDALEQHRANIWGSGHGDTVAVDGVAQGMSVGGVHQLIGNVWEWASGAYGRADDTTVALPVPMKSIRGGAFDTYFENQATCQFQSGESPLSRKHNIGFRLALGACDLAPQATDLLLAGVSPQEEPEPATEVTV